VRGGEETPEGPDSKAVNLAATSKKQQILALYESGVQGIGELALLVRSQPSYVASVLEKAGAHTGYHDLYTGSEAHPMNIYAKYFKGKVGFRDMATARAGVEHINRLYQQFAAIKDRAGQHHALVVALTIFDRARWSSKSAEASVYRQWLMSKLNEPLPQQEQGTPPLTVEARQPGEPVH